MVAHESDIFSVSRQLVIISLFFILCWKRKQTFHKHLLKTSLTTLRLFGGVWSFHDDIMWFVLLTQKMDMRGPTYEFVFAQELFGLFCDHVGEVDWALGLMEILIVCGGRVSKMKGQRRTSTQIPKDIVEMATLYNKRTKHMLKSYFTNAWVRLTKYRRYQ